MKENMFFKSSCSSLTEIMNAVFHVLERKHSKNIKEKNSDSDLGLSINLQNDNGNHNSAVEKKSKDIHFLDSLMESGRDLLEQMPSVIDILNNIREINKRKAERLEELRSNSLKKNSVRFSSVKSKSGIENISPVSKAAVNISASGG
jgi:hypothetical protein